MTHDRLDSVTRASLAAPGPRRRDRGPRRRARGCLRGVGPESLAQRERPECHGLRARHAATSEPPIASSTPIASAPGASA